MIISTANAASGRGVLLVASPSCARRGQAVGVERDGCRPVTEYGGDLHLSREHVQELV